MVSVIHEVDGAHVSLLDGRPSVRVVRETVRTLPWSRLYLLALVAVDLVAALTASLSALLAGPGLAGAPDDLVLALCIPAGWVAVLATMHLYQERFLGVGSEEFRRVGQAGVLLVALCGLLAYLAGRPVAREVVLVAVPLTVALDAAGRYLARRALLAQRRRGRAMHQVLLVGRRDGVRSVVDRLAADTAHGLHVVGVCYTDQGPRLEVGAAPLELGGLDDLAHAVDVTGADMVAVLSGPETSGPTLRQIAWDLEDSPAQLVLAPGLVDVSTARLAPRQAAGVSLLHLERPRFTGAHRWVKECLDRVVALVAIVVLMPALVLLALAIRMDRCGPALYRQTRVGIRGREFTLYKFRSMCADADQMRPDLQVLNDRSEGLLFKLREDPRVTRIGRVLRRFSLDELPQLVNVLRGEMSLVGPRPPLPDEVERYGDDTRRRLLVKPGLTGLWQVSGRSDLPWDESVRLDLGYVDNWSLRLDLLIVWQTFRVVFRGTGAY